MSDKLTHIWTVCKTCGWARHSLKGGNENILKSAHLYYYPDHIVENMEGDDKTWKK